MRSEFGGWPQAREQNRILNNESQAGLRPQSCRSRCPLWLYPYVGHTVVQPGTAGRVGGGGTAPLAHAQPGPDAEVCWRERVPGGRAGLRLPPCRERLRRGGTPNIFHLLWSASAVCRGRAGCARSGALPGGQAARGAPVRCRVRAGTCSLWAALGESSAGPRGRLWAFCSPSYPRSRFPQPEIKPCRRLPCPGVSWAVLNTPRCVSEDTELGRGKAKAAWPRALRPARGKGWQEGRAQSARSLLDAAL